MIQRIQNHIEVMREKPHHKKKQYAFFISLAVTLVIFGFWMASFNIQTVSKAPVEPASPISSLTASVGDAFTYVKELLFGASETKYSSDNVEVVGGKN